jgi:SAM-dependent methyltransferase
VRLAPEGLLVPARTLGILLAGEAGQEILYAGHGLEPWIRDGSVVSVKGGVRARRGDLILCEAEGWGDLRRVVKRTGSGEVVTTIDAVVSGRDRLPEKRILGVVRNVRGSGGLLGRAIAFAFPIWSRIAAFLQWRRKILEAPWFGEGAADSVRSKYAQQVEGYTSLLRYPIEPEVTGFLESRRSPGASILVAGCGAGGDLIHLARVGYKVAGFDFAPAMVEAARRNVSLEGVEGEVLEADMTSLDLPGRSFDLAYVTPLVYSFIAGRATRVEALGRLGRHLRPGGAAIFSASLIGSPIEWLELCLAWLRRRRRGQRTELGDWFTWFMTPTGSIGRSFLRRFRPVEVIGEARDAGFRRVRRAGRAHFIVDAFADPNRSPARRVRSSENEGSGTSIR